MSEMCEWRVIDPNLPVSGPKPCRGHVGELQSSPIAAYFYANLLVYSPSGSVQLLQIAGGCEAAAVEFRYHLFPVE